MESTVCLSASADGAALLIRRDLMEELEAEYLLLSKKLELNDVDREYHDILIDKREYVQVEHLHGFTAVMYRAHAVEGKWFDSRP